MKTRLGVSLAIGAVAAASSFACLSPDERDLDEVGGAAGVGGSVAGSAGSGATAGKAGAGSGGSAGSTGGGAGGSAGLASGGTGMVSGSGGTSGSSAAGGSGAGSGASGGSDPGTGGTDAGTGGTDPGTGGSENGGAGAGGANNAGAGAGGVNNAGSGGANNAGTSGSGMAGSTGNCVPNYDCELEPPPSTGNPYQDCVDRINQFRAECACLPPLERWADGEGCADQMAEYDSTRSAHAGFADGICEGGSAQNECPGWGSNEQVVDGCLQAMWSEGPPPQEPCEGQCFQDHGHFINMTNDRYTGVACGFYETTDGDVWAVQNFTR